MRSLDRQVHSADNARVLKSDPKWWERVGGVLAPCPSVVVFALAGAVLEGILLATAPQSLYQCGPAISALVPLFLFWFWLSVGCGAWLVTKRMSSATWQWPHWARWVCWLVAGAGLGLVVVVYLISWGSYLRSGRFANPEAVRFTLRNIRMLWLYLLQAERASLIGLGALALALMAALAGWGMWLRRSRWAGDEPGAGLGRKRRVTWYVLAILWMALGLSVVFDPSQVRQPVRVNRLRNSLNPVVALVSGGLESLLEEPIAACLDVKSLHPIGVADGKLPLPANGRLPSIMFVAVESLRADVLFQRHQSQEIIPNLNKLARRGRYWTRAYAQSTHSDYSDVCIVSAQYPLRSRQHFYYQTDDPWPRTRIYDLLKPLGYATAVISSQNEGWGAMDQFLASPNLDLFFDAEHSGQTGSVSAWDTGFAWEMQMGALRAGKLDDTVVADRALEWIREQRQQERPFFLSLHFQNSHFPYELSPKTPRPFQPGVIDFPASFLNYPLGKTNVVRNAYYNALHESDRQLGRVLDLLRAEDVLDSMILVVYGENGEAFHENGGVTHAQNPIEPAVRVACVVHAPAHMAPAREDYPLELVDIVPTVFGLVGWPVHPNFQGVDVLAQSRPPLSRRLIFLHTENPQTRTEAVVLAGRWKYLIDRLAKRETLFDLAADPTESTDVSRAHPQLAAPLRDVLRQWRRQQLAYYHFPSYYTRYYPPPPPHLTQPLPMDEPTPPN